MIFGEKTSFAIESEVDTFYEEPGLAALGFFAIYLRSNSFGVIKPNATMLAATREEVKRRIASRGKHVALFEATHPASEITNAIRIAIYDYSWNGQEILGMPCAIFADSVRRSQCEFHRRCDEAFDDGSMVLFFDVGRNVRCIAQKRFDNAAGEKDILVDIAVPADCFYSIIEKWLDWFDSARKSAERV